MTRMLALAVVLISAVGLSACANTARGVGKDVRNNGQATAKAVRGY